MVHSNGLWGALSVAPQEGPQNAGTRASADPLFGHITRPTPSCHVIPPVPSLPWTIATLLLDYVCCSVQQWSVFACTAGVPRFTKPRLHGVPSVLCAVVTMNSSHPSHLGHSNPGILRLNCAHLRLFCRCLLRQAFLHLGESVVAFATLVSRLHEHSGSARFTWDSQPLLVNQVTCS